MGAMPRARATADPFGRRPARSQGKPAEVPTGFRGLAHAKAADATTPERAAKLLRAYEARNRKACNRAPTADRREAEALRPALAAVASASGEPFLMGICAGSQADAIKALKAFTAQLGLPKGLLHGMDREGVAVKLDGGVFIKYHSGSGDAVVSGYDGESRGVLVTPSLADGFIQVQVPLDLWDER